jgi:hypothetical protein
MLKVIYEELDETSTTGKRFIANIILHIHMLLHKSALFVCMIN